MTNVATLRLPQAKNEKFQTSLSKGKSDDDYEERILNGSSVLGVRTRVHSSTTGTSNSSNTREISKLSS